MDKAGSNALGIPDYFYLCDSRNQLLEENSHFESRQDQPQALVRTGTKRKMPVGFSLDVELCGVIENVFIKTG